MILRLSLLGRSLFIFLFFIISGVLNSCSSSADKITWNIAVSSNAAPLIEEWLNHFHVPEDIEVSLIIGSSGRLSNQIISGAPYHLFFSADMDYPMNLVEKGLSISPVYVYAVGRLVLWHSSELNPGSSTQAADILKLNEAKIAIAEPRLAPYGRAAKQFLSIYKIDSSRLVFGNSISQVNQFISSGSVKFAFTSLSSVLNHKLETDGPYLIIDDADYDSIIQGALALKSNDERLDRLSQDFLNFIGDREAKKILQEFGYLAENP